MNRDGATFETGFHIPNQHCDECGQPDSTQSRLTDWGMRVLVETPCCGGLPCHGYVTTTPWIGRVTGREMWACCRGEADRRLGEATYLHLSEGSTT